MVSVIVIARNEEENIEDCIKSLLFCDEIILVDDNSTDRTVEIAEKLGIKAYSHSLNSNFSDQRNYGLEKVKGDWVLFIDADERVSSSLQEEIKKSIKDTDKDGFFLRRRDHLWGKELRHGDTGNIELLRLAKKDAGKWGGKVHETWNVKGKIGELKSPLDHYPHQSISEFLGEINNYTTLRAEELYEMKVKTNIFWIVAHAKAKFIQNYFLKLGFLDGIEGFIHAILMSLHAFLVRGKLWQLWHTKK